MDFILTDFNIVIIANAHNPSIINPDFLKHNEIVNADLKPIDVLCTPPFSQIRYDDNITIVIDQERLNISDLKESRIPLESPIPRIALKYMNILKYVPYKAVGINFKGFYDFSHMPPEHFLLNRFIKDAPELDGVQPVIGLKFNYKMNNFVHNLELEPATITRKKEKRSFPGLSIRGNFHYDQRQDLEGISEFVNTYGVLYDTLIRTLTKIFG